jgi:polysaccharide biosynthesis protein PslH
MRLLWIATKAPVPPADGGRLVQKLTLEALAAEGAEIEVLAPLLGGEDRAAVHAELAAYCVPHLVPARTPRLAATLAASRPGGLPAAVARHAHAEVRRRAAALLAARRFDLVHAEQLHAFAQAAPAAAGGVPVVLRAQNVESDLWAAGAAALGGPAGWIGRLEAWRLARWEGSAVQRAARTVALTGPDARRLEELASRRRRRTAPAPAVEIVPAPFPARLPAAPPLPGSPAVVVLASGDWPPNRDSRRFMVEAVWPAVRRRLPGAVLHLFGGAGAPPPGVVHHPPPAASADVFAAGSTLLVPLRIASGVRMKVLEAWARGVPVVATPYAAAGLEAEDGRELLVAEDGEGFAAAIARLAAEPRLASELTAAGRGLLAARHDPPRVARRLLEVYRAATGGAR